MERKHFTLAGSSLTGSFVGNGLVAVFRRSGPNRIEVGCFVVDGFCLGVRDAWHEEIGETGLGKIKERLFDNDCVERDGSWGRKLVEGAVDYARRLGFKPHRDYRKAARVFGGVSAADCGDEFTFGRDGKPLYIASEEDSPETVRKTISHLQVRCGEGNFDYLVPAFHEDTLTGQVDDFLRAAEGGRVDTAEAGLQELLKQNPDAGIVHYGLGVAAALRGDNDSALARFDEAVRLSPDIAEAWYNKGVAHKNRAEIVPMALAFQAAVKWAEPGDSLVEPAQKMIGLVEEIARKDYGLDLKTYLKAGTRFDQGFEKMQEGRWEEALADFEESARINPRSHQSLGNAGTCLIQLGRIREARESLRKALRIDPDYHPAKRNLKLLEGVDENNPPKPSRLLEIYNSGFSTR